MKSDLGPTVNEIALDSSMDYFQIELNLYEISIFFNILLTIC